MRLPARLRCRIGLPMNVCVVGAGAIGGWIAARLALAGSEVSVVARGETLHAIDTEGLLLTDGGDTRCAAVNAIADPGALGTHDLVVLAVKAPALPLGGRPVIPHRPMLERFACPSTPRP